MGRFAGGAAEFPFGMEGHVGDQQPVSAGVDQVDRRGLVHKATGAGLHGGAPALRVDGLFRRAGRGGAFGKLEVFDLVGIGRVVAAIGDGHDAALDVGLALASEIEKTIGDELLVPGDRVVMPVADADGGGVVDQAGGDLVKAADAGNFVHLTLEGDGAAVGILGEKQEGIQVGGHHVVGHPVGILHLPGDAVNDVIFLIVVIEVQERPCPFDADDVADLQVETAAGIDDLGALVGGGVKPAVEAVFINKLGDDEHAVLIAGEPGDAQVGSMHVPDVHTKIDGMAGTVAEEGGEEEVAGPVAGRELHPQGVVIDIG